MKKLIILMVLILTFTGCDTDDAPDVATIGIHPNTTIKTFVCDPTNGTICVDVTTDGEGDNFLKVDATIPNFPFFNHFFDQTTGDTAVLNGTVLINTKNMIVNDSSGFAVGSFLSLHEDGEHLHSYRKIVAIVGNNITLDSAVDQTLSNGSFVEEVIFNMNVDGSVTPQIFELIVEPGEKVDITRLMIEIISTSASTDDKFGGIAGLTNGVHIRVNTNNQEYETLAIWRENKDLKEDMYDVLYTDKAGPTNFGLNGRWTFAKAETVISLDGNLNETLELIIQDDLTTLVDFQIKAQGHFD